MKDLSERMLTVRDVLQTVGVRSRTTLRKMIRRDGFPPPYEITAGKRCWSSSEVQEWLRRRMAAQRNGGQL